MEEKAKSQPDSKVLLAATFKALQADANLAAWSAARVRDENDDAKLDVQAIAHVRDSLTKLYKEGNLTALEADLNTVVQLDDKLGMADFLTDKFKERYAKVSEKERSLTLLFILTYVLGSIMVGVDFVLQGRWSKEAV